MVRLFVFILICSLSFATSASKCDVAPDIAKEIVSLLSERMELIEEASKWKWNFGMAIRDDARRVSLHYLTLQEAKVSGLDADWADHLVDLILEQSERYQKQLFKAWREEGISLFPHPKNLRNETDPKLDVITTKLIKLLAKHKKLIKEPRFIELLKKESLNLKGQKKYLIPPVLNYIAPGRRPTGKTELPCTIGR